MGDFACFKCREYGHIAERCPLNLPAGNMAEHLARIAMYVDWWVDGRLTLREKRLAISYENQVFYGQDCPSRLVIGR